LAAAAPTLAADAISACALNPAGCTATINEMADGIIADGAVGAAGLSAAKLAAEKAAALAAEKVGANVSDTTQVLAKVNVGRSPFSEINGSLGELNGYKQSLNEGRIGVVEPGKASTPGVDYATFDPEAGVVYITDAKYRAPGGTYPSSIPQSKVDAWTQQVKAEVQGWPDSPQKTVILHAINSGNVKPEIFKWPQ